MSARVAVLALLVSAAVPAPASDGECHLACEREWSACVDRARDANGAAKCQALYERCVAGCDGG